MNKNKALKRIALVAAVIAVILVVANLPKSKGGMAGGPGGAPSGAKAPGGNAPSGNMPMGGMGFSSQQETVHSVKTVILEPQNHIEYLTMNGNVQANNSISVYPNIGGKITKVFVTLGSNVKRGDKIAEVDPSTPGSFYEASPVYAPISGTITSLPLTVGTSVNTSTSVAQIGNINELQIKARVPERDIAVLENDLNADVTLVAYKNEVLKAHVIRVSPIVDEVSRTKEIYLSFDKEDSRINAGMYAKIKLYTTVHKDALVIPFDAVSTVDNEYYVYVVNEDSTVTETKVQLGVNVDGNVQIVEGVSAGQKVVVSGTQSLTNGAKVKEI